MIQVIIDVVFKCDKRFSRTLKFYTNLKYSFQNSMGINLFPCKIFF